MPHTTVNITASLPTTSFYHSRPLLSRECLLGSHTRFSHQGIVLTLATSLHQALRNTAILAAPTSAHVVSHAHTQASHTASSFVIGLVANNVRTHTCNRQLVGLLEHLSISEGSCSLIITHE